MKFRYVDFAQALHITRNLSKSYQSSMKDGSLSRAYNKLLRYQQLSAFDECTELRDSLFSLVKPFALQLALPHAEKKEIEAIKNASTFLELPSLQFGKLYEDNSQFAECELASWWLVHKCLPLILPKADWTLMFPNDIIQKHDGLYVKARARQSNFTVFQKEIQKQVGFPDNEIGSVWHNGTVPSYSFSNMKFCVVADFTPTRKGYHLIEDEYDTYNAHEIHIIDEDVKIDVDATIDLWNKNTQKTLLHTSYIESVLGVRQFGDYSFSSQPVVYIGENELPTFLKNNSKHSL